MLFNLSVKDTATGTVERFLKCGRGRLPSLRDRGPPGGVEPLRPDLASVVAAGPKRTPTPLGADPLEDNASSTAFQADGSDGNALSDTDISDAGLARGRRRGLWLLEHADLFNLWSSLRCGPTSTSADDVGRRGWRTPRDPARAADRRPLRRGTRPRT